MQIFSKIISFFLLIPSLFGIYANDKNDTEVNYRAKIEQINFENTIETAIPQTELYNIISEHFSSDLLMVKLIKKQSLSAMTVVVQTRYHL